MGQRPFKGRIYFVGSGQRPSHFGREMKRGRERRVKTGGRERRVKREGKKRRELRCLRREGTPEGRVLQRGTRVFMGDGGEAVETTSGRAFFVSPGRHRSEPYFEWAQNTLVSKVVHPGYDSIVGHIQLKTLSDFKEAFAADLMHRKEGFADAARRCTQHFLSEFDKQVKQDASIRHVEWNSSEFRDKLALDIDDHVTLVRATKLDEYVTQFKSNLKQALEKPIAKHLDEANDDTWTSIRELFRRETASCVHEFSSALNSEFHLDRATTEQMTQELLDYAREVVKTQAASAANNVLAHMKNRVSIFSHDEKHMAKEWKNLKEIESRSRTVVSACVKMLSVRAVVRLADLADDIESILLGAFNGDANIALPNSNAWHEAYPDNTLISPVQCKDLLCELKEETKRLILRPAYDSILKRIQSETLYNFKEAFAAALRQGKESFADASLKYSQQFLLEFDERVGQDDAIIKHVDWNPSEVRVNIARDMDAHIASELAESYKRDLSHDLASPVARHLDQADHEMAGGDTSMQLIDGDGAFYATGLDGFMKTMKMTECGTSYVVVSIMGPQSSGKSTLLNHLFGTKFKEMDPEDGRSQTTKGIWLAKCVDIKPFTIVMDIEGNDGRERGEDDTAFEKQSALFALSVSDIVLINMWCNDIGREHAANKPLIRTVFQAMIQSNMLRKATLLFVIRDKTPTPAEKLESILKTDIQKIWDNVTKPQHQKGTRFREVFQIWDNVKKPQYQKGTRFSDFFHVEVVFLSNYEHQSSAFKEEVMSLRKKICHSITPRRLAGDGGKVVPASKLALNMKEIWKVIKENKDLDLPANKVMVATVRCEAIAKEQFAIITAREDWGQLIDAKHETVMKFENELSTILDECLSGYDMETIYFDETVRTLKREELVKHLLLHVDDAYYAIVGEIRSKTLSDFKVAFAKAVLKGKQSFGNAAFECTNSYLSEFDEKVKRGGAAIEYVNWDPSRDNLKHEMDAHVASVRDKYKKNKEEIIKILKAAAHGFVFLLKILSYIFGVPMDGVLDWTNDAFQALVDNMLPDEE